MKEILYKIKTKVLKSVHFTVYERINRISHRRCSFNKARGVLEKRCSENMQQIYRRAPMTKCDFNTHFGMGVLQ